MIDTNSIKEWLACGAIINSDNDGNLLLGFGPRRWLERPQNLNQTLFYFPDFFLQNATPWFEHEFTIQITKQELLKALFALKSSEKSLDSVSASTPKWDAPYQPLFQKTFKDLQQKFKVNELKKAVPFIFETSSISMNPSLLQKTLVNLLSKASPLAYIYGFWDNGEGMVGATPELLFHFSQPHVLETMACAGTSSISNADALLHSAKELEEHQIVVQGIAEKLSPYGQVHLGDIQVLKLPHLAHLVTPIKVVCDQSPEFEEIVKALHPTPALGAYPNKPGLKWLSAYQEQIDRQRFGAPVGFIGNYEKKGCYVAIRNVQWDKTGMFLGAGCGLTSSSHCEKEWDEINLKLKAIKEMLAL